MAHVFHVSKRGFDVLTAKGGKVLHKKDNGSAHMYPVLGLAYLFGAKIQLMRYRGVSAKLDENNVGTVLSCLHEISNLLEDLETIGIYLEKCGEQNKLNGLIRTMRNHIRHDVREQFNDESDSRKIKKHSELGIKSHLQTEMEFHQDYFKIGNKTLYVKEVDKYLEWAWKHTVRILDIAHEKGHIKDKFW